MTRRVPEDSKSGKKWRFRNKYGRLADGLLVSSDFPGLDTLLVRMLAFCRRTRHNQ